MIETEKCFEVGKCYRHRGGGTMMIIGRLKTKMYGLTLIGEDGENGDFRAVGSGTDNSVNWYEIHENAFNDSFRSQTARVGIASGENNEI